MRIAFACGHQVTLHDATQAPVCACGETRISRVSATAPSFRGVCRGPSAITEALPPVRVNLCVGDAQPLPVPVDPSQPGPRKLSRHAF